MLNSFGKVPFPKEKASREKGPSRFACLATDKRLYIIFQIICQREQTASCFSHCERSEQYAFILQET